MKLVLAFPALILLTATAFQDGGPILPPDGPSFSKLPGPNFSMTRQDAGTPSVSAGGDYSCGVTMAGKAYCWGLNYEGQLGNGTTTPINPVPVAVAGDFTFQSVSSGGTGDQVVRVATGHSCGVTTAGAAYCWGQNTSGQLGNGTRAGSSVPVAVTGGLVFQSVSAGDQHSCGVTTAGTAYCWGGNLRGQLGDNSGIGGGDRERGEAPVDSNVPVAVTGGLTFQSVSAGVNHTCGVTTAGAAYCWGVGEELGYGPFEYGRNVPIAVAGDFTFQSVSAGVNHTCGVTTAGAAYCWGDNLSGQLGYEPPPYTSNVPVPIAGGLTFRSVSAGNQYNCGVTTAGAAYCWGSGALGNSTNTPSNVPVPVSGGLTFQSVSAGDQHTCGVTTAGKAYCWGSSNAMNRMSGNFGRLGNGTAMPSFVPVPVSGGLTF